MKKLNYLLLLFMMAISTWSYAQVPSNNACTGAIDLSSSLGQALDTPVTTGPYDNTNATAGTDDLLDVPCFAENNTNAPAIVNNTLWFKITGDGEIYNIIASSTECSGTTDPIENNDTQIAVYVGGCGGLILIDCNEDYDTPAGAYYSEVEINTQPGIDYYIMVDGYDYSDNPQGVVATGEYCMTITKKPPIACSDPNVGVGTLTAIDSILCQPEDTVAFFTISEGLAPTEGNFYGYLWAFSTQDLAGTLNLTSAPGYLGTFPIASTLQTTIPLGFAPNMLGPGTYYATLYVFGNGTADVNGNLIFDENCTFVSNSARVDYYSAATCPMMVDVLEVNEDVLGMTVFPNPVQDVINLNVTVKEQLTDARLMITNLTGQIVKQQLVNLTSGANTFSVDVNNMPSGIYMVSIESDTHQSVTRFVKR